VTRHCSFSVMNQRILNITVQQLIIFGKTVAKEIGNMQSLTCLLLTVQMSSNIQFKTFMLDPVNYNY